MSKVLLAMVLVAGVGLGAYHFILKPKPAFDVGLLEDQLEHLQKQMEGKRAMLEGMAGDAETPAAISGQIDYMYEVGDILERRYDCAQTATELRSLAAENQVRLSHFDQGALLTKLTHLSRAEQQKLVARLALDVVDGFERLVPLVDDYCDACPKESAVFHEVLF
jgi:hypothetical protein